jgi:hypothetical protein
MLVAFENRSGHLEKLTEIRHSLLQRVAVHMQVPYVDQALMSRRMIVLLTEMQFPGLPLLRATQVFPTQQVQYPDP